MASSRGIKTSTVVAHMSDCITAGLPVDIRRLGLSEGVEKLIIDTIRRPPINSGMQDVHYPHDVKYSYFFLLFSAILFNSYFLRGSFFDFRPTAHLFAMNPQFSLLSHPLFCHKFAFSPHCQLSISFCIITQYHCIQMCLPECNNTMQPFR